MAVQGVSESGATPTKEEASSSTEKKERRQIPGGFSYTMSPGVFQKVLQRLIQSERPPQFGADFMSTVLQASGGSARAIPPILKRAGFLTSEGVPTERYAQFQSDTRRPAAALEGLKAGWPELYRRNSYAHRLEGTALEDAFKEITGLQKSDTVFKAIVSTFKALQDYIRGAQEPDQSTSEDIFFSAKAEQQASREEVRSDRASLTLANQITIVLPVTTDISVYNAIFRSLKENIL